MVAFWTALFVAVSANIFSNIAFKIAVREAAGGGVRALAREPWLWAGIAAALLLLVCYLYAIRSIQIAIAYPIVTGMAMAGIAFFAWLLIGEPLGAMKILGIGFVLAGVALLSSTV